jgi:hypothetical protein
MSVQSKLWLGVRAESIVLAAAFATNNLVAAKRLGRDRTVKEMNSIGPLVSTAWIIDSALTEQA